MDGNADITVADARTKKVSKNQNQEAHGNSPVLTSRIQANHMYAKAAGCLDVESKVKPRVALEINKPKQVSLPLPLLKYSDRALH